jgi:hypothetical protein
MRLRAGKITTSSFKSEPLLSSTGSTDLIASVALNHEIWHSHPRGRAQIIGISLKHRPGASAVPDGWVAPDAQLSTRPVISGFVNRVI